MRLAEAAAVALLDAPLGELGSRRRRLRRLPGVRVNRGRAARRRARRAGTTSSAQSTMVQARITVPASFKKRTRARPSCGASSRRLGRRYGGSSRISGTRRPLHHRAPEHARDERASSRSRTRTSPPSRGPAPASQPNARVGGNSAAMISVYTGSRAEHVISGITSMVSSRSRCRSMVRVARIAGTAQAKPESIGTNARPCRPSALHHAIHQERDARHVARVLEQADEEEEQQDLRQEHDHVADAADDAVASRGRASSPSGKHRAASARERAHHVFDERDRRIGPGKQRLEHDQHQQQEDARSRRPGGAARDPRARTPCASADGARRARRARECAASMNA